MSVHPYGNSPDKMAWHDETTARRLMAWIQLYDVSKRIIDDNTADFIISNIVQTGKILSSSSFYKKMNNHGMFQDQALLIYSDYFSIIKDSVFMSYQAVTRMNEYFTFVISDEGVHLENSPSYHQAIAQSIGQYRDYFIANNNPYGVQLDGLYNKMMRFATFIIKPDGYFPQIGDTPKGKPITTLWNDPGYLYAATQGKSGVAPSATEAVFLKSGYVILRDRWSTGGKGTYIAFTAAYKSAAHKHNDDLNVLYYHDRDILIEAGPYGYDYTNDYTKYVYSSYAHNTLIVDNKDLPATPNIDKKYNMSRLTSSVSTAEKTIVTGVNERFNGVKQERSIEFIKGSNALNVTDVMTATASHNYKLLWNLAPDIDAVVSGNTVMLNSKGVPIAKVEFTSGTGTTVKVVKGQTSPYLLGWYFDKLYDDTPTPTSVIIVDMNGSNSTVSTKFTPLN
ncbi:alginate lyase family protein [Paenibacillus albus]|uniref:Alginate lyase family protein n=1 Tax=Paenibacillus albus TaxID=2495582 RepID=A0A3S9AC85_9BACL|nr:alginate lyase family protein [Paenibacillus albus]